MARFKDHEKALNLRRQGMSYSQIKKLLKVSKGTSSVWLRDYPLSKQRIRELRDWNEQRIERCRETKRRKKEKRLKEVYELQEKILLPLKSKEIFMMGLGLYWGEGTKHRAGCLSVSNTDPSIIRFFICWLNKSLGVSRDKMKVALQLYSDMNINKEMRYWSGTLKIPLSQFVKPYIKKNSSKNINHKGGFGHGTCNLRTNNTSLSEKIIMGLKVISDKYGQMRA